MSTFGYPAPIEEVRDLHDLMTQMINNAMPQPVSTRNGYNPSSPLRSQAGSDSEDGSECSNGLATQAPLTSTTCKRPCKVIEKSEHPSNARQELRPPMKQLLGLIRENKKSSTSVSGMTLAIPEQQLPVSPSDKPLPPTPAVGTIERHGQSQRLLATVSERDPVLVAGVLINENNDLFSSQLVSKMGNANKGMAILTNPGGLEEENSACSENESEKGSQQEAQLVNPSTNTMARSRPTASESSIDTWANQLWPNKPVSESAKQNPWASVTRIPRRLVTIPKDQLELLANRETWVPSGTGNEIPHAKLPPDIFLGSKSSYGGRTAAFVCSESTARTTIATENGNSGTVEYDIINDSLRGEIEISGQQPSSESSHHTISLIEHFPTESKIQDDAHSVAGMGSAWDDAISWASTSRAPSVVSALEDRNEFPFSTAMPPMHPHTSSLFGTPPEPTATNFHGSPRTSLGMVKHPSLLLPAQLPAHSELSNSELSNFKAGDGGNLRAVGGSLLNNFFPSSGLHSEDDMEQILPYALCDDVQSSEHTTRFDFPTFTGQSDCLPTASGSEINIRSDLVTQAPIAGELYSSDFEAASTVINIDMQLQGHSITSTLFENFGAAYPDYHQSLKVFIQACVCIEWLLSCKMAPHPFLWDDFAIVFSGTYFDHVEERRKSNQTPKTAIDYYNTEVEFPRFTKGVLKPNNISKAMLLDLGLTERYRNRFQETLSTKTASKPTRAMSMEGIQPGSLDAVARNMQIIQSSGVCNASEHGRCQTKKRQDSPILGDELHLTAIRALKKEGGDCSTVSAPEIVCREVPRIEEHSQVNLYPSGYFPRLGGTVGLSGSGKTLSSVSPVNNVFPLLPSSTSPTSKRVARAYIPRRERKKQMNGDRRPSSLSNFN